MKVNMNVVGVPRNIVLSRLAGDIKQEASEYGIELTPELQLFYDKYYQNGAGYTWETQFLQEAQSAPLDLLEKWLKALPSGLARAELRGLIKARKQTEQKEV